MSTLIHLADLHISSAEADYSLTVLDEIFAQAADRKADFILMAGDIFDTQRDAYSLREEFRRRVNSIGSHCEVLYLPGNHEALQVSGAQMESLDLGNLRLLTGKPCTLLERGDIEVLAVPHQDAYEGYRQWKVPPKQTGKTRISLAHTNIAGMSYTGFEGNAAVMDTDLFDYYQIDYAALGHIHARRQQQVGGTLLSYPGSARVWRRGEFGPRGINLVQTGKSLKLDFVPLFSAGEYREYRLPLNFEGVAEWEDELAAGWGPHDQVELQLCGIVEDEHQVSRQIERLQEKYAPRLRVLNIIRNDVTIFNGISSHPVARQFIRLWKERDPGPEAIEERLVWLEARELGLREIKELLEARE